MKVVVNHCWGGFSLSPEGVEALLNAKKELTDEEVKDTRECSGRNLRRNDPILVKLVEEKGSKFMSGELAQLEVVEIPDSLEDFWIEDNDGAERVVEPHRSWGL